LKVLNFHNFKNLNKGRLSKVWRKEERGLTLKVLNFHNFKNLNKGRLSKVWRKED
jgi:hypothetical protein